MAEFWRVGWENRFSCGKVDFLALEAWYAREGRAGRVLAGVALWGLDRLLREFAICRVCICEGCYVRSLVWRGRRG